jgi:hypothetical protein
MAVQGTKLKPIFSLGPFVENGEEEDCTALDPEKNPRAKAHLEGYFTSLSHPHLSHLLPTCFPPPFGFLRVSLVFGPPQAETVQQVSSAKVASEQHSAKNQIWASVNTKKIFV